MTSSLQSIGWRLHTVAAVVMSAALGLVSLLPAQAASIGDIDTFAVVPATPGFPEGVLVHGNRVFVSGPARADGTLADQQHVSGFIGRHLVKTFRNGDLTQGNLTSPPFKIERRFIAFLMGGG